MLFRFKSGGSPGDLGQGFLIKVTGHSFFTCSCPFLASCVWYAHFLLFSWKKVPNLKNKFWFNNFIPDESNSTIFLQKIIYFLSLVCILCAFHRQGYLIFTLFPLSMAIISGYTYVKFFTFSRREITLADFFCVADFSCTFFIGRGCIKNIC